MKKFNLLALMSFCLLSLGCATTVWQKELSHLNSQNFSNDYKLNEVIFIDQSVGFCGPASLAMAMHWAGLEISAEEIAGQVYSPASEGSYQSDLIGSSRRNGLLAIPIYNLSALLVEVESGHPVVVLENLALSWFPKWHYSVVVGYDLKKQEIIMHSGHNANYRKSFKEFERTWKLAGYWGLIVLPAGNLATSADERAHVTAVVGLEQAKQIWAAEKSYLEILERWPNSLVALVGLANIAYSVGERAEAVKWLNLAVKLHPNSDIARHNLNIALAM